MAAGSPPGELILLDDQDRSRWNRDQIAEGSALLERALRSRRFGPYTLQAAIAAVHANAPSAAATDWTQIVLLYDVLARAISRTTTWRTRPHEAGAGAAVSRTKASVVSHK